MVKKKFKMDTYYECVVCDCGGLFIDRVDPNSFLASNPPQAYFECNLCGERKRLREPDWPQTRAILGEEIV